MVWVNSTDIETISPAKTVRTKDATPDVSTRPPAIGSRMPSGASRPRPASRRRAACAEPICRSSLIVPNGRRFGDGTHAT